MVPPASNRCRRPWDAVQAAACCSRRGANSIEREPHNTARTVTAFAMSGLSEGAGQLPFLRFITPLGYGVRYDVV
jgi:hypothetical protein